MIDRAASAYLDFTRQLVKQGRIYDEVIRFGVRLGDSSHEPALFKAKYDELFPRTMLRCDSEMSFATWLVNGVFPRILYEEVHNSRLMNMHDDPRFASAPIYSKKDGWSSFFGRAMGQKRNGTPTSFLQYLIGRMSVPMHRAMPHFYFPTEDAAWVFEPLMNNMRLLKTGRTALACAMAFSFKYDTAKENLHMTIIMRSNQWSHLYGDVFGGRAALLAVMAELGLPNGQVALFSPSYTMDTAPAARQLLQGAIDGEF